MSKPIAIAFSDLHAHKFTAFNHNNSRLKNAIKVLRITSDIAHSFGIPMLFNGDLLHTNTNVENKTITSLFRAYKKYIEVRKIPFYAIPGNHDMSEKNSLTNTSPTYLDGFRIFKTFHLLSPDNHMNYKDEFTVYGVPYMNNDEDTLKAIHKASLPCKCRKNDFKILLLHTDLPGAKTPSGFEVGEAKHFPTNMSKLFEPWNLVLNGHIHKPQKISPKIFILGSPLHQDQGDAGCDMGYWLVYKDSEPRFFPLPLPQFVKLKEGEKPYNETDYFIYPTVVKADKEVKTGEFDLSFSKSELATRYCKTKGIKSKKKKHALDKILNAY